MVQKKRGRNATSSLRMAWGVGGDDILTIPDIMSHEEWKKKVRKKDSGEKEKAKRRIPIGKKTLKM